MPDWICILCNVGATSVIDVCKKNGRIPNLKLSWNGLFVKRTAVRAPIMALGDDDGCAVLLGCFGQGLLRVRNALITCGSVDFNPQLRNQA